MKKRPNPAITLADACFEAARKLLKMRSSPTAVRSARSWAAAGVKLLKNAR